MKPLVREGPGKPARKQRPRTALNDPNDSVARITRATTRNNEINSAPVTRVTAKDQVRVVSSCNGKPAVRRPRGRSIAVVWFGKARRAPKTLNWLAISALCWPGLALAPARAQSGASANGAPQATAAARPAAGNASEAQYVGSETCKSCHQEIYDGWEKTPHWKTTLDKEGGPSKQGCEGCHGPGAEHVAGGGDKTKIFVFETSSTKQVNARCLSCHAGGPQHMNAINSIHSTNNVSCISCHSPHHAESKEFLLVKAQPELCYTCHLQQKSQFQMPFHHRVNEGLVECSDCHNVHGTVGPKQVRTSSTQDAVCFGCHTDKQGPFVFEHEPVKIEGCSSCHIPHGGANVHMLRVSNVNLLCLQCHTSSAPGAKTGTAPAAPSFHSQETFFKSCTLCHSQVHGSNFDPTFFK